MTDSIVNDHCLIVNYHWLKVHTFVQLNERLEPSWYFSQPVFKSPSFFFSGWFYLLETYRKFFKSQSYPSNSWSFLSNLDCSFSILVSIFSIAWLIKKDVRKINEEMQPFLMTLSINNLWNVWFRSRGALCLPEVFCEKLVLRNFAKFTGKYLCQSLF